MVANILTACLTLFVIVLVPIVHACVVSWKQWRTMQSMPTPPILSWVWGHGSAFMSTKAPLILAEWTSKYGGVVRIRFLHKWAVIVTEPALVRAILQNSKTYVPKERQLYRAIESASHPALPNILTSSDAGSVGSDGKYWAAVRAAWMKCFTSTNLKRVFPTVVRLCEQVIEQQVTAAAAAAAKPSDNAAAAAAAAAAAGSVPAGWARVRMCDLTDRITLDVIGVVAYGRDFGAVAQKRNHYLRLVSGMLQLMHEAMDHPLQRFLRKLRPDAKQQQLRQEWDAANTAEVMAAMEQPPGEHTIAGQLLRVRDPSTGAPLSADQLKAEMVVATLAGFETTSNALSWTLGALACHPEALQQLEQELDAAGLLATPQNPNPPAFAWQQLGKLQYLQAVIREGLRLFSPAANGSFRLNVAADLKLREGLVIPKGVVVGVPFFAFGHNPETYGADVEDFRPDRWITQRRNTTNTSSSSSSNVEQQGLSSSSSSTASDASHIAAGTGRDLQDPPAAAAAAGADAAVRHTKQQQQQQVQDPWSFSIGPRDCAGQALARMELQVLLAMLVGRMHIKLDTSVGGWEGLLQRRLYHTTLQIEGGLPMLLQPRMCLQQLTS